MTSPLAAARRWAAALDADDFTSLPGLMSRDCVYHTPGGALSGPDAIVASYQSSSEWAHATFDSITWDSQIEMEAAGTALITFIDTTDHQGQHHVYRCQQRVRLNDDLLVAEIEHIAIPEEEIALAEFFARVGVSR